MDVENDACFLCGKNITPHDTGGTMSDPVEDTFVCDLYEQNKQVQCEHLGITLGSVHWLYGVLCKLNALKVVKLKSKLTSSFKDNCTTSMSKDSKLLLYSDMNI